MSWWKVTWWEGRVIESGVGYWRQVGREVEVEAKRRERETRSEELDQRSAHEGEDKNDKTTPCRLKTHKAQEKRHDIIRLDPSRPHYPIPNHTPRHACAREQQQIPNDRRRLQSEFKVRFPPFRYAFPVLFRGKGQWDGYVQRYNDEDIWGKWLSLKYLPAAVLRDHDPRPGQDRCFR